MLRRAFLKLAAVAILHPALNWQIPPSSTFREPVAGALTVGKFRRAAEILGYFDGTVMRPNYALHITK